MVAAHRGPDVRILDRVPRRVRCALDDIRLWVFLACAGVIFSIVALYFVNGRTARAVALQTSARVLAQTEAKARAAADYTACVVSIPNLHRINRFVNGVQAFHEASLENARALHRVTPRGSFLWVQQKKNITRIGPTVTDVSGIRFPVPTVTACVNVYRQDILSSGLPPSDPPPVKPTG